MTDDGGTTSLDAAFLLRHISDACYLLDHEWRFVLVNARAEQLLGHTEAELRGRNAWIAFPGTVSSGLKRAYEAAVRSGETRAVQVWYPEHGRWYAARAHPVPEGLIVFFHDDTGRVRTDEHNRLLIEQLAASNKELSLRAERLRTLHDINVATSVFNDRDINLRQILHGALSHVASVAFVYVQEGKGAECLMAHVPEGLFPDLSSGDVTEIADQVATKGELLAADLTAELSHPALKRIAAAGVRSLHGVPFSRGPVSGVLVLLAAEQLQDDHESLHYLSTLAGYVAITIDSVRMFQGLERTVSDYRALARFGQKIETIFDVDELVTQGLSGLIDQLRVDYGTLAEVVGDQAIPIRRAGDAIEEHAQLLEQPIPLNQGAVAQAVRTGKPVLVQDYHSYADRPDYLQDLDFSSVLVLPIDAGPAGNYIILLATTAGSGQLDETAASIATHFAQRIANAFERVSYLDEVGSTREATFRALGLALEFRDYETKGHTDRVAWLATRFAETLGFTPAQIQAMQWGAYLHDLGKLSVPDQILLKPTRLEPEEFELIKRHPVTGWAMCQEIPFLPDATRNIVRHHHEKWDGTGYPDSLAGTDIPLEARMFALVDIYDALTSQRPYREAWSREEAVSYLQASAGRLTDPDLTRDFITMLDSGGGD